MKVILIQDVKGVGKKGDILDASDGHARNYLLPKKLAVEANKTNINDLEQKKKSDENKKFRELEEAKETAKQLEEKAVRIQEKSGDNGKIFGSVTAKEIGQALEEQTGMKVDKKKIVVSEPIKSIGQRKVDVKLHPDVTAKLLVDIYE